MVWLILGLMVAGAIIGYFLRNFKQMKHVGKVMTWCVYFLLFFLGISVGHNKEIINNLGTIGLQALAITIGSVFFSVLLGWLVYKKVFIDKRENQKV